MTISSDGLVWCKEDRRTTALLASPLLNGIDFVEFVRDLTAPAGRQVRLEVTFLKSPMGLVGQAQLFHIQGGVRIVNIRAIKVEASSSLTLGVFLDREGDFSPYRLCLKQDTSDAPPPGYDAQRSEVSFGFKAGCPTDFDCPPKRDCPVPPLDQPALDYLAKDYQSFRRLMVDLIPALNPRWTERLPADLGMTLVELFAYVGDYLSQFQDAAGTEAYLDRCLHRISAARHVRLVDYRMHHGRNAYAFVHFEVTSTGVVPDATKLVTRIGQPLVGGVGAPGTIIGADADFDTDPALADTIVFETTAYIHANKDHNRLLIHSWGDLNCCLALGSCEAYLYGPAGDGNSTAYRPTLKPGEFLLLEEERSPISGARADADPTRRQVVRLVTVEDTEDSAYQAAMPGGQMSARTSNAQAALPLQKVTWRKKDALKFTLCLSAEGPATGIIEPVSVARGNVAPADHGRTIITTLPPPVDEDLRRWPYATLALPDVAITQQAMPDEPDYDEQLRPITWRYDLDADVRSVVPAIVLELEFPGAEIERWESVPHLLDSGAYDQHFVAEIDNIGQAKLRFGDDQYGRRPLNAQRATAHFRVGNGPAGNVGAGALVHIVSPDPAHLIDPDPNAVAMPFAGVARVYQPLAARLGAVAESIEEVRQFAPEAFRAIQFRAVTEADWCEMALRHPGVAAAVSRFRWTGSWHTVFVSIQPKNAENLVRLSGGGADLAPAFATEITAYLRRFKIAGYDLRVRAAIYVPLEIEIRICVARGHFRGDVAAAVGEALSNRALADGRRGFFHLQEFTFGQAVYLSRLYSVVEAVAGVDSATVTKFKRYWATAGDELDRGLIAIGDVEIARLDNDPSAPEMGALIIKAVGGL